jgi:hypothetical protein
MKNNIISPDFFEASIIPPGKLSESIHTYQHDLQTGLVEVDITGEAGFILLFARGQLVTAYREAESLDRLDPATCLEMLNKSASPSILKTLALTPQDVRIFKILIEQKDDQRCVSVGDADPEKQFQTWKEHPILALAQVRWPTAEALAMFPGLGVPPFYTLFMTSGQVLHSAGGVTEIFKWKESTESLRLFSCEPRTLAWTEYLLHFAFSSLVSNLLGKFEKLAGRIMLNQVIREVNFKATAHDWNLSINASSVNDQTIFDTPLAAAEVYSRLLEVVFHQIEALLGSAMLDMFVREAIHRLPLTARQVVNEFLPFANLN